MRITAQLIKVDDGFHLWSETYDRELNDIFAVQEEIARAVAGSLKVALLGEKSATPPAQRHECRSLQRLFTGTVLLERRSRETWKRRSATSSRHQAGPALAPAWVGLAMAHNRQAYFGYAPFAERFRKGRDERLSKLLTLDRNVAGGLCGNGTRADGQRLGLGGCG